jgi:hypothetical protein
VVEVVVLVEKVDVSVSDIAIVLFGAVVSLALIFKGCVVDCSAGVDGDEAYSA